MSSVRVREAIDLYVADKASQNWKPSTIHIARHVLQTVFEPALADDLLVLTTERLAALRSRLSRRARETTGAPLTESLQHTYLRVIRAFLAWAASKGWMLAELAAVFDLDRSPTTARQSTAQRFGGLLRTLREPAGLTRREFGERTRLSNQTLVDLETGRRRPSRWTLQLLLQDPCTSTLLELAQDAGIELELEEEPDGARRRDKPS